MGQLYNAPYLKFIMHEFPDVNFCKVKLNHQIDNVQINLGTAMNDDEVRTNHRENTIWKNEIENQSSRKSIIRLNVWPN